MALLDLFSRLGGRVFGTRSERLLQRWQPLVARINALEPAYAALSDDALRGLTRTFRGRFADARAAGRAAEEALRALLPEAFAAVREAARRRLGLRPYDVQLLGGIALHEHKIAEMLTGEGKTLVATLPAYLNALHDTDDATGDHRGVHVVTVNDYLARRDAEWMGPVYEALGLTVGFLQSQMPAQARLCAYLAHVTYGTASEFGFDYLRDHLTPAVTHQVQRTHGYVLIDEVDSILIDEARTPLIISGQEADTGYDYGRADAVARTLDRFDTLAFEGGFVLRAAVERDRERGRYYVKNDAMFAPGGLRVPRAVQGGPPRKPDPDADTVALTTVHGAELVGLIEDETADAVLLRPQSARMPFEAVAQFTERECSIDPETQLAHLDERGIVKAERALGLAPGGLYEGDELLWPHLLTQALRARFLYQRDVHYVVEDRRVVIVNEFTGRKMPSRRWSDGLHQAIEAKEGLPIQQEDRVTATITIQNYFRLYQRRAGMTGTAKTEETEFQHLYNLEVVQIPPNKPCVRDDALDVLFGTLEDKEAAIVEELVRLHAAGRPVLVGTTSVEKSERLYERLVRREPALLGRIEVLNARHHAREAEIVARAGRPGALTIATNMAGRGTDIVLGGAPEQQRGDRLECERLLAAAAVVIARALEGRTGIVAGALLARQVEAAAVAMRIDGHAHHAAAAWRVLLHAARERAPTEGGRRKAEGGSEERRELTVPILPTSDFRLPPSADADHRTPDTDARRWLRALDVLVGELLRARDAAAAAQALEALRRLERGFEFEGLRLGACPAALTLAPLVRTAADKLQRRRPPDGEAAFRALQGDLAFAVITEQRPGADALRAALEALSVGVPRPDPRLAAVAAARGAAEARRALAAFLPPAEDALRAEVAASWPALHERVVAAGGLFVLGTERHEARRIDNQLKGRGGRQGDPGASRFYLSLEDDLMRLYMSERIRKFMMTRGFERGMALESGLLSRSFEKAQQRVEQGHFEGRRSLLVYDGVMDLQRRMIYDLRAEVLAAEDGAALLMRIARAYLKRALAASFHPALLREAPPRLDPAWEEMQTRWRVFQREWRDLTGHELDLDDWRRREDAGLDALQAECEAWCTRRIAEADAAHRAAQQAQLTAVVQALTAQLLAHAGGGAATGIGSAAPPPPAARAGSVSDDPPGPRDRGQGEESEPQTSSLKPQASSDAARWGAEFLRQVIGVRVTPDALAAALAAPVTSDQWSVTDGQTPTTDHRPPDTDVRALIDAALRARIDEARALHAQPPDERRAAFRALVARHLDPASDAPPEPAARRALFEEARDLVALEWSEELAEGWSQATLATRFVPFCERGLAAMAREFQWVGSPLALHLRQVALAALDRYWTQHLTELETLRRHVRMEAYAQHDPRDVYRRAGKELFEQTLANIYRHVLAALLRPRPARPENEPKP